MSSTGAAVDPRDKMRARDVNRVARGEQAPRPVHEYGTVSAPPSPQSTSPPPARKIANKDMARKVAEGEEDVAPKASHCYDSYVEYHKCIKEKGKDAPQCDKLARHFRSLCPDEWIERWDEARAVGTFPAI
ncbi:hypothetical protein ES319_D08G196600v1 [Gossypium barbadense]|uniref:CHCH domain-containing protein n=7 Tax=Gossypium TaxID=3633 RepID=A0A0D2S2C0_GOSRA|nr:putative cytochrome c oxidase subunit 6b-like [Gossypium raimondii]KAB2017951.1 hypothetical protein ES319_D08G196600v1 [Gossypium barbadense]MBA0709687.1 hypothetical protein [Gossypium laxum]MBA0796599.1 hypothetical protein [Gossypium harknessii]TYG58267.1 hypothetical protein ES288_D08G208700v1 [Gossypium darwinii]TYH59158.1 hypothetical protein ES332_D08G204300v1 [Gossypium tomentosum]